MAEKTDKHTLLEEEGDVAADYLEELLDIADLDGDIDIDVRHGRAAVEIVAEQGLDHLVGKDGVVLDALQDLTRLAVQARTGERSRLMLDVAGHRAARHQVLSELGSKAVAKAKESGRPVELEPLNSYERKVIHDVVAAAGLRSDSQGSDPYRFVVVHPPEVCDKEHSEAEPVAVPDYEALGSAASEPGGPESKDLADSDD